MMPFFLLCNGCSYDSLNISVVTFKVNEIKPWILE
jgi:hypothetical protein